MFKKFNFSYSNSSGAIYSLTLKQGKWLYESKNDTHPMDVMVDGPVTIYELKNKEVITSIDSYPAEINPSDHRIKRLHNYLKQYCKRWEKEYAWMQYDDGNIWECDIEGENFKLKSRGNVEEPANFETFLHKLTVFTEGKYFGPSLC